MGPIPVMASSTSLLPSAGADGSLVVANGGAWVAGIDKDPKARTLAAQDGLSGGSVTGGALIASSDGATTQLEADGIITVGAIEVQSKNIGRTIYKTETGDISADDLANTIINNYGQGAIATLTLPACADGMACLIIIGGTGYALHIKAGASDKIYLDGTALDDGDKVSLAVPALGNCASVFAFKTGASSFDWYFNTISGVFTDGGS